uniref:cAMP responsive element binding protein 5 n=1 Tax=Poecilia reticulata TaxID=8081 RepID=A0A3P9MXF9_POERE
MLRATFRKFYETLARGMNSDQERPFVCNAPGCSQRFPTEDHLMIHRHKHEMTLKFPSIKNDNMLSDQTPTPTRFLKNCEEVGLFSDLDCSIEQDFCKAQEEEDSKQVLQCRGESLRPKPRKTHNPPPGLGFKPLSVQSSVTNRCLHHVN